MKIEEYPDGAIERKVLIGMITNPSVLSRIAPKWEPPGLFASSPANQIGRWCVTYHRKYAKAPNRDIEGIFRKWAETNQDKASFQAIETLLEGMSGEYDRNGDALNPDFVVDLANGLFEKIKLEKLAEEIKSCTEMGKLDQAKAKVGSYRSVGIGSKAAVDILQEPDTILNAFNRISEPLLVYPGALGQFFGHSFQREKLIAFMAPEKGAKSWFLLDVAYRAVTSIHRRSRVAHFVIGDMDQDEILVRYCVRMAKKPDESSDGNWPYQVDWPVSISKEETEEIAHVAFKALAFEGPLSGPEAVEAAKKVRVETVCSDDPYLRLVCRPMGSINVHGIRSEIESWGDWTPDFVICDYADNLEPIDSRVDRRDQINDTWKALKQMASELHCCVVTATQSNRESYDSRIISRRHISEDKRKSAHVDGMVGINSTGDEKKHGIFRLGWVVRRKGYFNTQTNVHIAGCLALGNPCVRSCW